MPIQTDTPVRPKRSMPSASQAPTQALWHVRKPAAWVLALCCVMLSAVLFSPEAKAQFTGPCSAQPLGVLPIGSPLIVNDDNDGGLEPDPWPDCGNGINNRWYRFVLPPGYTNVRVIINPFSPLMELEASLFDSTACGPFPVGAFIPGTDVCEGPGVPIETPPPGVCLPEGGALFLRVGGPVSGPYQLILEALDPSCGDGCRNGFETGVDSLEPPKILVSAADSSLCAGDLVFLQVEDPFLYSGITWGGGIGGPVLPINLPGSYQVMVSTGTGCDAVGEIRLFYDSACVWPGDVDRNDRVSARDLLPIGQGFGTSGPPRMPPGPDPFVFLGQAATDWGLSFRGVYDGLDFKHGDVDGNGLIDGSDLAGIQINYGAEIPADAFSSARFHSMERAMAGVPLTLEFNTDSFEVGDTIQGRVLSGDSLNVVEHLYGYALELDLPEPFMVDGSFSLDFSDSWLDDDGNVEGLFVQEFGANFADISYTRTDQVGRTGYGELFGFSIVVEDNLDGRLEQSRMLPFGFDALLALDSVGDTVALLPVPDSVLVSEFCDSWGNSTASEYIDGFKVNSKKIISGDDGGYSETVVTAGQLQADATYLFGFKPGFTGAPINQYWRLWLDINADGDFDDPGELLLDQTSSVIFQQSVSLPDSCTPGWTTLRVQMKREDGVPPGPCDTFAYGEVQDYKVEMLAAAPRMAGPTPSLNIWPNPVQDRVQVALPAAERLAFEQRLAPFGSGPLPAYGVSPEANPNPELQSNLNGTLSLQNAAGQVLVEWPLPADAPLRAMVLDLGGLPAGWYRLQWQQGDGVVFGSLYRQP